MGRRAVQHDDDSCTANGEGFVLCGSAAIAAYIAKFAVPGGSKRSLDEILLPLEYQICQLSRHPAQGPKNDALLLKDALNEIRGKLQPRKPTGNSQSMELEVPLLLLKHRQICRQPVPILVQHVDVAIADSSIHTASRPQQPMQVNDLQFIEFHRQYLVKPCGQISILALDPATVLYTYLDHCLELMSNRSPGAHVAMYYLAMFGMAEFELRQEYRDEPKRWLFPPGSFVKLYEALPEGNPGHTLTRAHWNHISTFALNMLLASAESLAQWDLAQCRIKKRCLADGPEPEVDMDDLSRQYKWAYTLIIRSLEEPLSHARHAHKASEVARGAPNANVPLSLGKGARQTASRYFPEPRRYV